MVTNNAEDMPNGTPAEPVGGQGGPADAPGAEERGPFLIDRASLDALLSADEPDKTPGSAPDKNLPKDKDLPPDKNLLSEEELAALIAERSRQETGTGIAPAADTSQFFDASTLESLLDDDTILGAGDATPHESEVEAMLAEQEPKQPPSIDDVANATLDQSAVDALLAIAATDLDGAPADAVPGEAPDMLQPPGLEVPMTDEDLEAPIIQVDEASLAPEKSGEESLAPTMSDEAALPEEGAFPEEGALADAAFAETVLSEAAPQEAAPAAGAKEASPTPAEPVLSAEMINTLTAAAGISEAKPAEAAQPEETPAAVQPQDVTAVLNQALKAHRKQQDETADAAGEEAAHAESEAPAAVHVWPGLLKLVTTLAVGTVSAMAAFTFLYTHQERFADPASVERLMPSGLTALLAEAERLSEGGSNAAAAEMLAAGVASAGPDAGAEEMAEGRYVLARVTFMGLEATPGPDEIRTAMDRVNAFIDMHPRDPRVVDCLRWKAALLKMQDAKVSAAALYDDLITRAEGHPDLAAMLVEAAKSATDAGRAADSVTYLERLLREFPGSAAAREAKLMLGESYARAGKTDEAVAVLASLAQTQRSTGTGPDAVARLAQIELGRGRAEEAVRLLEEFTGSATTVEGNDKVYLALGQAYRAAGRITEARTTLNDILNFFPESETTPAVYVELCRLLESEGQTDQAMTTARKAAKSYPKDALVLGQFASMLENQGAYAEAAPNRLAAYEAGGDPMALLAAARDFRKADAGDKAIEQYRRLVDKLPGSPEALEGSTELCQVLYEQGQATEAVNRLENLALATPSGPRQLPVLIALGRMYGEIGLNERAIEVYKKVAAQSTEPSVLAMAATSLMSSEAWDEGIALARRVDVGKLSAKDAVQLLAKLGEGLLMKSPQEGAEVLAKAYADYPEQRTAELEQMLLRAWLALGKLEEADGLVNLLQSSVECGKKEHFDRLVDAAILCGDAAFERGDYGRAAGLYGKVTQPAEQSSDAAAELAPVAPTAAAPENTAPEAAKPEMTPETAWAKYQQANSLMRLSKFGESALLFDEVAASTAPFAEDAKAKAAAARVEQRVSWTLPASSDVKAEAKEGTESAAPKTG